MVYLGDYIRKLRSALSDNNLATLAYYFVRDKDKLKSININNFSGQEQLAAKGYLSSPITEHEINQITKPAYKGVDITYTIFKLIGAYLAAPGQVHKKITKKFEETTFRNQFLISRCVPSFRESFKGLIKNDSTYDSWIFRVVEGIAIPNQSEIDQIGVYLETASDCIDLLILEELFQKLIQLQTQITKINNLSAYDTIVCVLTNFNNSIKKITQGRRTGHALFSINDEYDVQDLLYVILKSFFPALKEEDPTPRVGAKSNKIDLILREEGILLEVKMIKQSNINEKDFVEQLKNDIQSYRNCQWLKYLLFFVYDPFKKTRDAQNFYDLNGQQSINGTTFSIKVILS